MAEQIAAAGHFVGVVKFGVAQDEVVSADGHIAVDKQQPRACRPARKDVPDACAPDVFTALQVDDVRELEHLFISETRVCVCASVVGDDDFVAQALNVFALHGQRLDECYTSAVVAGDEYAQFCFDVGLEFRRQKAGRDTFLTLCERFGCALENDASAFVAAVGPKVDHIVGAFNDVRVVFDD